MTLFPIVERELRVASRQPVTYWSRFGAAAAALGLGFWILCVSGRSSPSEVGSVMFTTLSACLFIYIVIVGTLVACDCVSEEKRDGTLGLLFLTDLKGYDIVFGKLSATSLRVLYGVIATIPILAIPILLGGVSYGQFWRVVLTALNLLFFSLATGILASSLCRSGSKAVGVAALIGGGLLALTPLIVMLAEMHSSHSSLEPLLTASPALDCFFAFDSYYRSVSYRLPFWVNALVTHCYAWLFLIVACRIVPRSWRDEDAQSVKKFRLTLPKFLRRDVGKRAALSTMGTQNPYRWRCTPNLGSQHSLWGVLVGLVLLACLGRILDWSRNTLAFLFTFMPIILNILVKCWASFQATRQINEDRRSGGLELLLATPLSEGEIIQGQRQAFWSQFFPVIVFVLLIDSVLLILFTRQDHSSEVKIYSAVLCCTLIADMQALSWVGLWTGLSARSANRAASGAIVRILVVPSVVAVFIIGSIASSSNMHSAYPIFIIWGMVSLLSSIAFSEVAKNKLATEFRSRVAHQGADEQKKELV